MRKSLHETLNQHHHHPKLWYQIDVERSPLILTPPTGNIIFKISGLLESCQVKVNGRQVEFNALTCIEKA